MMLVRKEKTNILERRNKFTLFVDRLVDSDVTVPSLVDVENILFDAVCSLLISPRNEGIIRNYGRENTQKKGLNLRPQMVYNDSCQPLMQDACVPN